jgi:hypothetical protein
MPGSEVVEGPVRSLLGGDIKLSCTNKSIDGKAYLAMVLVKAWFMKDAVHCAVRPKNIVSEQWVSIHVIQRIARSPECLNVFSQLLYVFPNLISISMQKGYPFRCDGTIWGWIRSPISCIEKGFSRRSQEVDRVVAVQTGEPWKP